MTPPGAYTITEDEQARVAATQQLAARGAAGIPELVGMLTDPSWVVRRAVVEALGASGDAAVGPLCEVLRTRRDHEARIAAAVDALVASRGEVDGPVLNLAADPHAPVVADAVQILGRRRSHAAVPTLIGLTRHPDDNVAVGAIEALGRIGGRAAVEALIEVVSTGNFFRTFPAIDVLGRSGDPRVVEPLSRLLDNPSYLPEAARALGRCGERAAVKPLANLLRSRSDAVVRVAAVAEA
ncbi:MAG: HEAT repeat domain-containing protein, partial [Myxococcales bacterium]